MPHHHRSQTYPEKRHPETGEKSPTGQVSPQCGCNFRETRTPNMKASDEKPFGFFNPQQ